MSAPFHGARLATSTRILFRRYPHSPRGFWRTGMVKSNDTPFESIESAHEYVGLLAEVVEEARTSIIEDLANDEPGRRQDALRVIHYKLDQLQRHLLNSRRLLNDLRTLRRLLLRERVSGTGVEPAVPMPVDSDSPSEAFVYDEPARW